MLYRAYNYAAQGQQMVAQGQQIAAEGLHMAAQGCQGVMLPRRWNWLLSRGAKVGSYLGAGIGCCLGAPRYDLTLVLALAVATSSTASCTGPAF